MSLGAGTRLGPYEILSPLGAGGMGEVYRARDSRLQRDVAIKVLSERFGSDRDRLARFEREAQLLAALSHVHIAAIFGFEESGGVRALVMELVEGPTLAERVAAGPLPLGDALGLARMIAEAFEYAHARGIVHRDNESGRDDVYVQPYPGGGAKIPVSPNGGTQVLWARDGRELFHREGDWLMSAAVQSQPFKIATPARLFSFGRGQYGDDQNVTEYDAFPDGKRFVAVRNDQSAPDEIRVVVNFTEELKRLVR